jgi:hypothetical protein
VATGARSLQVALGLYRTTVEICRGGGRSEKLESGLAAARRRNAVDAALAAQFLENYLARSPTPRRERPEKALQRKSSGAEGSDG